jgi:hypothetical protein
MRVGDKCKGIIGGYAVITAITDSDINYNYFNNKGEYVRYHSAIKKDFLRYYIVQEDGITFNSEYQLTESEAFKTDQHYDNTNGSIYKFAHDHGLNAYEFDCIKRIVRCRKKGQFKEDLEKTKRVIDLYLKEFEL